MASPILKTEHLKTQAATFIKQYINYDGVGRPFEVFTAEADATDGKSCSKVTYEYVNPTSSRVLKMKEENANWDATWDI